MSLERADKLFQLYDELEHETINLPMFISDFISKYGSPKTLRAINKGLATGNLTAEVYIYAPDDPFKSIDLDIEEIHVRKGRASVDVCYGDYEDWEAAEELVKRLRYEFRHRAKLLDTDKPCIRIYLEPNDTISFRRALTPEEIEEAWGEIEELFE